MGCPASCQDAEDAGAACTLPSAVPTSASDALTARTLNVYVVAFVRPVTVYCVVFTPLDGTSVQFVPLSVLYCHLAMPVVVEGVLHARPTSLSAR